MASRKVGTGGSDALIALHGGEISPGSSSRAGRRRLTPIDAWPSSRDRYPTCRPLRVNGPGIEVDLQ